MNSEVKHITLFLLIASIVGFLAFSLETSKLNNITETRISGNRLLTENDYLEFARISKIDASSDISISIIRDRLDKHPYIEKVDVLVVERGLAEIKIFEKKMDAILLEENNQFLISDMAEIIPFIPATKNIDLPVIVANKNKDIQLFRSAINNNKLLCALQIITTAKLYDNTLYENISEINLTDKQNVALYLSEIESPIYFGLEDEIEKTVYLSKIFKHIKGNKISKYIDYIDLRYNQFVYLGLDEKLTKDKGRI